MTRRLPPLLAVLALLLPAGGTAAGACTTILVTRGASADGSVMITYACDGEFTPRLRRRPAADHAPGETVKIGNRGEIPQVPHTYAVVGLMNEHQVAITETTWGGRKELRDPDGLLHYWNLMILALERAATAREAIDVMTTLVDEYGYASTGESFYVADPREAWMMEMIGRGPGRRGAIWVALRVPDGYVAVHANRSRIGELPPADPDRARYSPDVVEFAVEHGWYDPASGRPFVFHEAYDPRGPAEMRYTATREWSVFRRVAPHADLDPRFHRGDPAGREWPLWIRPERKLAVADVMALMRDHYEGTPWDMTRGLSAGPFGCPVRYRPMLFEVDGRKYTWERPISTQQTAYSVVAQCRSWLPDPVGGVLWYGVDDTSMSVYVPLYCGIEEVPAPYATGDGSRFSWDSAWWVFNLVSNWANLRWKDMAPEIHAVRDELERRFHAMQPLVEKTALGLMERDPVLARRYLTDYSVQAGEMVFRRWQELAEHLIWKYNDGYVRDEKGRPRETGYPEEWLREVVRSEGDRLALPADESAAPGSPADY